MPMDFPTGLLLRLPLRFPGENGKPGKMGGGVKKMGNWEKGGMGLGGGGARESGGGIGEGWGKWGNNGGTPEDRLLLHQAISVGFFF